MKMLLPLLLWFSLGFSLEAPLKPAGMTDTCVPEEYIVVFKTTASDEESEYTVLSIVEPLTF